MNKIRFLASGIFFHVLSMQAQVNGWTKITTSANPIFNLQDSGIYRGTAWIDLDNDNDLDLFASPNFLFRNDGGGVFVQLDTLPFSPSENLLNDLTGGCSWADLNNDGFIDCIIAHQPSGVFLNNGNSTFTNSTAQIAGLQNYAAWGCAIGSLDNDAYLDFAFAHAANFHVGGPFPGKLYQNTNNTLQPVLLTGLELTDSTKSFTVPYWSDFDLDGDMDLFVASGPGGSPGYDFCYRNLKIETGLDSLERITNTLFASQLQDGQCYNFIDSDNDGDLDLCLTNYGGANSRLYQNNAGNYVSITTPWTNAALPYLANCWGDYDNDGDLDMITTSDNLSARYYRNDGANSFTYINTGISTPAGTSGATNGDYDNDGDLDIYVHGKRISKALFRNDTVAGNRKWVSFKLTGTNSNTSAIGAIVEIKATLNGVPTWQIREINAQNSFQSQNDLRVHFGLNDALVIDSVVVRWPSGQLDYFTGLNSNTFYFINETSGLTTSIAPALTDRFVFSISPNPSTGEFILQSKDLLGAQVYVYDASGKLILTQNPTNTSWVLNLKNQPAGYYVVKISSGQMLGVQKILKIDH
jgi:enediyne biosynthesis protein E4